MNDARLYNIGDIDSIAELGDEGRFSHALSASDDDNEGQSLLIEGSDHLVALNEAIVVARALQHDKESLLELCLAYLELVLGDQTFLDLQCETNRVLLLDFDESKHSTDEEAREDVVVVLEKDLHLHEIIL